MLTAFFIHRCEGNVYRVCLFQLIDNIGNEAVPRPVVDIEGHDQPPVLGQLGSDDRIDVIDIDELVVNADPAIAVGPAPDIARGSVMGRPSSILNMVVTIKKIRSRKMISAIDAVGILFSTPSLLSNFNAYLLYDEFLRSPSSSRF